MMKKINNMGRTIIFKWCPNGCGKKVTFQREGHFPGDNNKKHYSCLKCKKRFRKQELDIY